MPTTATKKNPAKVDAIQQSIEQMEAEEQAQRAQAEADREAALEFFTASLPKLAGGGAVDTKTLRRHLAAVGWTFDELQDHVGRYRHIQAATETVADRDDQAAGDRIRAAESEIEALKAEIKRIRQKQSVWSTASISRSQMTTQLRAAGLIL